MNKYLIFSGVTVATLTGSSLWGAEPEIMSGSAMGRSAMGELVSGEVGMKFLNTRLTVGGSSGHRARSVQTFDVMDSASSYGVIVGREGTSKALVLGDLRVVADEDLIGVVTNYLNAVVPHSLVVDVDFVRLPLSWKIPSGEEVKVRVSSAQTSKDGMVKLTVQAYARDQVLSETRVSAHVSVYQDRVIHSDTMVGNAEEFSRVPVDFPSLKEMAVSKGTVNGAVGSNLVIGSVSSGSSYQHVSDAE